MNDMFKNTEKDKSWRDFSLSLKMKDQLLEYPLCDDTQLRWSPVKSKWNKQVVIRKHKGVEKDGNYTSKISS